MGKSDVRRFRRVPIELPAHITVNTVDQYEGRLINISPGDMALLAETKAVPGDAVVVRIKGLDVIEGTIARVFPGGFAVSFILSKKRRAILTEKLMLFSNRAYADGLGDQRAAPRHRQASGRTITRLADGTSLYVRIIDQSVDGVSVDAAKRPPIGSEIHMERQRGVVVRHTPRGFVVVYEAARNHDQSVLRAV